MTTDAPAPGDEKAAQEWEQGVAGIRPPERGSGYDATDAAIVRSIRAEHARLVAEPSELAIERSWRSVGARLKQAKETEYRSEVLALLAAADADGDARPKQLFTAGGFGLSLLYAEDSDSDGQITVLVRCLAPELISAMIGRTVVLNTGTDRFESSPFNPDGEALIVMPASVKVSDGLIFQSPVL